MTVEQAIIELMMALRKLKENAHCDNNREKSFDMAIEALNRHIPKKTERYHHCPHCGSGLPAKGIYDDYCRCCFNWKYCPYCGQALKWEV